MGKVSLRHIRFLTCCLLFAAAPLALANEPIEPVPRTLDVDADKARLGRELFFETRLSRDGTVSCATCHDLEAGFGTDLKPVSTGINGQTGNRNSPTVYNAALNFRQFWDGRADDLAAQAVEPIVNPVEMGMRDWDSAVQAIAAVPTYVEKFNSVFGSEVSAEAIQIALAEFQKTLITPNAPFDRFLAGDSGAITDEQKRGYELFKAYGCSGCHQGRNVGGNMFQKFGVLKDINLSSGSLNADLGRYEVTGNEWDKRVFKVPSLRLAVHTPPYFHDGSVATLEEAVEIMIEFQLGRTVPDADKQAIIAFLHSLPGEIAPLENTP